MVPYSERYIANLRHNVLIILYLAGSYEPYVRLVRHHKQFVIFLMNYHVLVMSYRTPKLLHTHSGIFTTVETSTQLLDLLETAYSPEQKKILSTPSYGLSDGMQTVDGIS